MFLISHRGNLCGPTENENHPKYILNAINAGYDVEVDVWLDNGSFYLGHSDPQYLVDIQFFLNYGHKMWCHAKNIDALYALRKLDIKCFYHSDDKVTLTSNGFLWTHESCDELTNMSICVLPDRSSSSNIFNCAGICSDYIAIYRKHLEAKR